MNMREMTKEYRLSHWAERMAERQASGLSITAYCLREGMHEKRYYYWQRKLREVAVREMAGKEGQEIYCLTNNIFSNKSDKTALIQGFRNII